MLTGSIEFGIDGSDELREVIFTGLLSGNPLCITFYIDPETGVDTAFTVVTELSGSVTSSDALAVGGVPVNELYVGDNALAALRLAGSAQVSIEGDGVPVDDGLPTVELAYSVTTTTECMVVRRPSATTVRVASQTFELHAGSSVGSALVSGAYLRVRIVVDFDGSVRLTNAGSCDAAPTTVTDTGITLQAAHIVGATAAEGRSTVVTLQRQDGAIVVTAAAGTLPPGARLVVTTIAMPGELTAAAPAPAGSDLVLGFVVQAFDANGQRITEFDPPITIEFPVSSGVLPEGVARESLVLTFWNGERWLEVPATITVDADGAFHLTASVDHLSIFAVFVRSGWGTLSPQPAASGVSLGVWGGGALGALPQATSYWIVDEGRFVGYVINAPTVVNQDFMALFPNGVIPPGTIMLIVR